MFFGNFSAALQTLVAPLQSGASRSSIHNCTGKNGLPRYRFPIELSVVYRGNLWS